MASNIVPEKSLHIPIRKVRIRKPLSSGFVHIGIVAVGDARKKKDVISSGSFLRPGVEALRQWHARKVSISPPGEVTEARD